MQTDQIELCTKEIENEGEGCDLQKAARDLQIAAFKLPKADFKPKNP
jgi:hypothetical protein